MYLGRKDQKMRKKYMLTVAALLILTSCNASTAQESMARNSPDTTLQPVVTAELPYSQEETSRPSQADNLDLTQMSSTMIYAQVYNIVQDADIYFGSTIKMSGEFMTVHDDTEDIDRYCCIVKDETECCMTGFELQFDGEFTPPEEGAKITVEGQLDFYEQEGARYLFLGHAVIQ